MTPLTPAPGDGGDTEAVKTSAACREPWLRAGNSPVPHPNTPASELKLIPGRVASLDGWRAISIVLVMVSHTLYASGFPYANLGRWGLLFDGELGVRIFFILSGFIITHLLRLEGLRWNQISLRRFYARRALRILPVYFSYLLVLALLTAVDWYHNTVSSWVGSVTFTRNMLGRGDDATIHCWSLAVEEQFYLLWPLVFVRAALWKNPGRALWILLVVSLACSALRIFIPIPGHDIVSRLIGPRALVRYADSLAIGCAAALLFSHPINAFFRRGLPALGWITLLGTVGLCQWIAHAATWPASALGLVPLVQGIALALIILASTHTAAGFIHTALNHPVAITLGALSYSLYLWHFLFLSSFMGSRWSALPTHAWQVWWIGAIVVSVISYYALERPVLRLRRALSRV